jgi:hypothetical protein
MNRPRPWRLLGAALLVLAAAGPAAEAPPGAPAQAERSLAASFVPTDDEIRRYLAVLPALMREIAPEPAKAASPRKLSREAMARIADVAGFDNLERFARTHLCVLAGYTCLQAEAMRADLAAQMIHSPPKLVRAWQERIESLDAQIAVLRREIAPEALDKLRPLVPTLERMLTPPPASPP